MFNLFKKKSEVLTRVKQEQAAEVAAALDLDKEIVVHAMPPRFRQMNPKAGSAKKTGLLILVIGLLVLGLAAAGFYYFLFIYRPAGGPAATTTPESAVAPTIPETTEKEQSAEKTEVLVPSLVPTSTVPAAAETDVASSSASVSPPTGPELVPTPPQPSADTDTDGLTDAEENLLGSNSAVADSDGDGFSDSSELNNLYDPAGAGKLSDNRRFKTFKNDSFDYSVLAPSVWPSSTAGGDYTVIFTIQGETPAGETDNQLVQIDVQPNIKKRSVTDWYKDQFNLPAVDPARLIEGKDKSGKTAWIGIKGEDGRTIYLVDAKLNYLITLNYNLGLSNLTEYPNIFNAMIKSFLIGA